MIGTSPDRNQPSFLLPSSKEQVDPNHPIYQLNERINWSVIEEDFKKLYSHTGCPAKPVRLMVSLLLLKQLEDLSDEQVIRRWVDIPYWQYLSGETHFQWKPPAASSDLTHFRIRIGKKVRNVYRSCRSISSIQRSKRKKWSLIPRSRKKTSPIPSIPNWRKKSLRPAGTLRNRKGFP